MVRFVIRRARVLAWGLFVGVSLLDVSVAPNISLGVLHFPALILMARWGPPTEAIALVAMCALELWAFGPLGDPLSLGATMPVELEHAVEVLVAAVSYAAVVAVLLRGRQIALLRSEVRRDPLTRLGNRRALAEHLDRLALRGAPVGFLVVDIDHFKDLNDTWGHAVGDQVLQELARRIAGSLREADAIARTGGEEFVAVIHDVDAERAMELAERIRLCVEQAPFRVGDVDLRVTISVGVAVGAADEAAIVRADEALYAAKRAGRNRVVLASSHRG